MPNKNIYKHHYDDPLFKIGHRLDYYRHLKDLVEGHRAKARSLEFRNKLIREQKAKNYQMEYDRLRNVINHGVGPGLTTTHLENRKRELERLGAQAFDFIR